LSECWSAKQGRGQHATANDVYPTRRIQMQGGPNWIDSERFDIVAKADEAQSAREFAAVPGLNDNGRPLYDHDPIFLSFIVQ
jgi:Protein of unknown function (DUF3738)